MSSIDDVIRERLQKLKANDSTSSLPSTSATTNSLPKQKNVSAAEQVENLLAQLSAETHLDVEVKKAEEDIDTQIRSRLERLKSREGCNFSTVPAAPLPVLKSNDDIFDEDFFKKSSCTELLKVSDSDSDKSCDSDLNDSEDEDNLCVVCDKKPTLICLGCDKDFYCKTCFKQFHSSEERHKTVPYTNKN